MKKITTTPDGRIKVQTVFTKPSRTQQQFKDACDVNKIIKKYKDGGAITHLNPRQGTYGDFTDVKSFQESIDIVRNSQEAFMALPALLRRRFDNDPASLMQFLSDPKNLEEAIELGLIDKPQAAPQNDEPNDESIKPRGKSKTPPPPAPEEKSQE